MNEPRLYQLGEGKGWSGYRCQHSKVTKHSFETWITSLPRSPSKVSSIRKPSCLEIKSLKFMWIYYSQQIFFWCWSGCSVHVFRMIHPCSHFASLKTLNGLQLVLICLTSTMGLMTDSLPRRSSLLSFSVKHTGTFPTKICGSAVCGNFTSRPKRCKCGWKDL